MVNHHVDQIIYIFLNFKWNTWKPKLGESKLYLNYCRFRNFVSAVFGKISHNKFLKIHITFDWCRYWTSWVCLIIAWNVNKNWNWGLEYQIIMKNLSWFLVGIMRSWNCCWSIFPGFPILARLWGMGFSSFSGFRWFRFSGFPRFWWFWFSGFSRAGMTRSTMSRNFGAWNFTTSAPASWALKFEV